MNNTNVETTESRKENYKKLKDVHTEHCCVNCGCKYGEDEYCPVVNKTKKQSYTCKGECNCW